MVSAHIHLFRGLQGEVRSHIYLMSKESYSSYRIIVSCIRDQGRCPCTQCLVQLSQLEELGSPEDMNRCVALIRVDDDDNREKVQIVRDYILNCNQAVSGKGVEAQLMEHSLTPTDVHKMTSNLKLGWLLLSEYILEAAGAFRFWYILYACCGSHAWVWIGCLEGFVYPSAQDTGGPFQGNWAELDQWTW